MSGGNAPGPSARIPSWRRIVPSVAGLFRTFPGDVLVRELLDEIELDEQLGRSIGVDLTPAGPDPSHAPAVYLPLSIWLQRADEVCSLREAA